MIPQAGLPFQESRNRIQRMGLAAVFLALCTAVQATGPAKITESDRSWWSFQPIRRPALPPVPPGAVAAASVHPIDVLVRAGLEAAKLTPNPPATQRELIRRAYFDLIGLPPTPEQMEAFVQDGSPEAWPRLIDHLLALPQYGERQGRHWLDVVRFAQSNGYERDGEKPQAWRYRDYVVKAFNADKPYDQFVREQLAGDELDQVTPDSIVATGFQRLGIWDDEPDDKRLAEFDELDDVLSTTGTAFLGLTIGCARCHDHKFDPIPQTDYYRLLGFFRNLRLSGAAKFTLDSPNYVPLCEPSRLQDWRSTQEAKQRKLQDQLGGFPDGAEKDKIIQEIAAVSAELPPFEWALAVRERGLVPPPTHVLIRGNPATPGPEVQPAFLSVLNPLQPNLPVPPEGATSTGRRRALAEWIASPDHPLTARVMVNRIWQHHFGQGLVRTASDFGRTGSRPSHPALLDWLAAEFIGNGWSMKHLHRTIMLSQTWQQSSHTGNAAAHAADPGNELLWRQNLRRLEAEALRDSMLSISGTINPRMGGRGFFPRLAGEVLAGQSRPGLDWEISSPEELSRRSLYAFVRRTLPVPMLEAFDYSNTTSPLSERPVTTVSTQALLLLNDRFMQEQASALADRLERDTGAGSGPLQINPEGLTPLIERGFRLATGWGPTEKEKGLSLDFIARQRDSLTALRTRLNFRPDVPPSLSEAYLRQLRPEHFIVGPRQNWTYHQGSWAGGYEGIRTVDRDRGPFALLDNPEFTDGTIAVKLVLPPAGESAAILFRGSVREGSFHGYEVAFEPRGNRMLLRRQAKETTLLAEVAAAIPPDQSIPLKIAFDGARIRIWLHGEAKPVCEVTDPFPLTTGGHAGVRTWGASLTMDDLVIHPGGQSPVPVLDPQSGAPERRALESFCLLLLNLNGTVYID